MIFKKLLYAMSIVLLISSCVTTTTYYQVYKVQPTSQSITNSTEKLFFEDENCQISYNLWENGGNIGFNFYNKTDNYIYINLKKTHFILNGSAYDYFKDRTYTISGSSSSAILALNTPQEKTTVAAGTAIGYSTSVKEKSIICIPPKTSKIISEYPINKSLIRNCDLFRYPRKKQINTKSYTKEKSPIVFSNRIVYNINGESKLAINKFFVSEITNYPELQFFDKEFCEHCGQKSLIPRKVEKLYGVNKFYIKYKKTDTFWKH